MTDTTRPTDSQINAMWHRADRPHLFAPELIRRDYETLLTEVTRLRAEHDDQPDPVAILTAYAEALQKADGIDARVWAEALRWAASRIGGSHGSLHTHRAFRQQFGQIAEHCGADPWDGTEGITTHTTQEK